MQLERYDYLVHDDLLSYDFWSDGPKEKVKKMIRYHLLNSQGISYLNLSFGDWLEEKQEINFLVTTDNKDRTKVLATVASTVLRVTAHFTDLAVYATGSTPSRTRFYQIGIASYWHEIKTELIVFGSHGGHWKPFCKNINFEGFG